MGNLCISILITFTTFPLKNVAKVLAFSAKNYQSPNHSFSDKKFKGIVYLDKSTISFNLAELKFRSPYQAQPL